MALAPAVALTDTQLRILEALCRPALGGNRYATPATNQEIAEEVFLSVDAVKAHLRTLYRKFGIEDLAHNQKRARLFELVLEGEYLAEGAADGAGEGTGASAPAEPPKPRPRRALVLVAVTAVALAAVAGVLALAGAFAGSEATSTGLGAYKSAVRGYCRLALAGAERNPSGSQQARAGAYLEVIETMRGRLESLPPPAASNLALERFREGLAGAADFTSVVAQRPPAPGTPAEANVVAELTFAAGQVQAGARGYGLGPSCLAIGELVTGSAENAAGAP
jgi:hypothetical protein